MFRKYVTTGMFAVALLFCTASSYAQMVEVERGYWLLGVMFKLQRLEDDAIADIRSYKSEIAKSDRTIGKAERIIRLARQKGNAEAERVAGSALVKARQAKWQNMALVDSALLSKNRAQSAIVNVRNLLKKQLSTDVDIRSVVTGHSGRVSIFSKRRNESISLDDNRADFLEPGDEIWTAENSRVEMQFLDGRGILSLGARSRFRMEKDGAGKQLINMLKGKIYISVDKLDQYRKMVEEKLKSFKEDVSIIKDEVVQQMVKEYELQKDRYEKVKSGKYSTYGFLGPFGSAPLIRTPTMVLAIRGTKFLVVEDEKTGSELIVLEGVVDVVSIMGKETIPVDAGYKIRTTNEGVISNPEMVDLEKIKKWWK